MGIRITDIAFVGYPVSDLGRARDFYERILGLECTMDHPLEGDQRWIEYDIGTGALAISNVWQPTGESGPTAAFEVEDFDGALESLRAEGVTFKTDVMESPGCHFVIIADPDGNDITIHRHKS